MTMGLIMIKACPVDTDTSLKSAENIILKIWLGIINLKFLFVSQCKLNQQIKNGLFEPYPGAHYGLLPYHKEEVFIFPVLANKVLFRNCPIMYYVYCDMLLHVTLHVWTLESTLVRSSSLGACNPHTKPMSQSFYRLDYFQASFPTKKVSSSLYERTSVRKKMEWWPHVDMST